MEKKYHVYKITNKINNKIYIGKTAKNPPQKRFKEHIYTASLGPDHKYAKGRFQYLHCAILKYSSDNFIFEALESFETDKEALDSEIKYIETYNPNLDRNIGYNLTKGGDGVAGWKMSEELKKHHSEIKKIIFLGEGNPFFGKQHTTETKRIIGEKAKERDYNGERNPFYGKTHSEEVKNNMIGNQYGKLKLRFSNEELLKIRRLYATGEYWMKDIAKMYGVHRNVMAKAIKGKGPYKGK